MKTAGVQDGQTSAGRHGDTDAAGAAGSRLLGAEQGNRMATAAEACMDPDGSERGDIRTAGGIREAAAEPSIRAVGCVGDETWRMVVLSREEDAGE